MTAGCAASRRVLARTPVAPLPASSPKRPTSINGRTSAPPEMYLPEACSFQFPKVCSFRLPLTNSPQQTRLVGYLRIIGKPLSALVWGRHELSPRPASPTCGSLLHDRPSSVRTPRRSVGLQPTMTPTHSDQLPLRCPLPADAIRAGVPRGPWGRGRARQPANWSVHSGHAIAPVQDGILRELAGMRQLTGAPIPPPKQTDVSGRLGLIRFGGHLPKGAYDVDHDGHAGQADAIPAASPARPQAS